MVEMRAGEPTTIAGHVPLEPSKADYKEAKRDQGDHKKEHAEIMSALFEPKQSSPLDITPHFRV